MKPLLTTILLLAATSVRGDDMQAYLNETQKLVREKKYDEALERCLWFHEHALEHNPGMSAVRLSFALSYWKSLGDAFPPARLAMVDMRDQTAEQVRGAAASFEKFSDVVALNRTLGENEKTIDLFQFVDQRNPELAKQCWVVAKDNIIAAKRYDLVQKYLGDPEETFLRLKFMYESGLIRKVQPADAAERLAAFHKKHFVDQCVQLIAVVAALGDQPVAKSLQQKALAVIDDPRLRGAIPAE